MAHSQNPPNSSFRQSQFRWKTDPTFYPTARLAMESPGERYAYDFIGLAVLSRSWINLDLIWCFSLLGAAVVLFFAPLA
jgi:hypothetical protein